MAPAIPHSAANLFSERGPRSLPASLMIFTIPGGVPIPLPVLSTAVVIPTEIISYQMFQGKEEISLPRCILDRSVPRSAFSACVTTILPFLEKAEGKVRPRWRWASSRAATIYFHTAALFSVAMTTLGTIFCYSRASSLLKESTPESDVIPEPTN
ncbi:MAG: exopolysaccharide biosynthesis protein [Chthoniobacterales bacterium]